MLSSIRANETPDLPGRYALRGMTFPDFTAIEVQARTLDDIVAEHYPGLSLIDWLSIDVEGTEIDVMRGLSTPARVIVAEASTEAARDELFAYMRGRGYVYATELTRDYLFTLDQVTVDTLIAATFDILTEATQHPLGSQATLPWHSGQKHRR